MNSSSKPNPNANQIIPRPWNASRQKRRRPEPFRIISQTFRGAKLLRKIERQAANDDSRQPGLVPLGALRINLEKLAHGVNVPADSWARLARRMLESQ